MIALSVNLNKIALIRNSRDTRIPDIPEHARREREDNLILCKDIKDYDKTIST